MVAVIMDIILRLGLDGEKLRGQCYNGCNTIMGKKKKVATQIRKCVKSLALLRLCCVHSLNLACGNWIRNSTVVSKSLDALYEIAKLVKFSPKRDSHLRKIHQKEYMTKMKIIELVNFHRWDCLVKPAGQLEQAHWQVFMKIIKTDRNYGTNVQMNTKIEKQRHGFMVYCLRCKPLSIFLLLKTTDTWVHRYRQKICTPRKRRKSSKP